MLSRDICWCCILNLLLKLLPICKKNAFYVISIYFLFYFNSIPEATIIIIFFSKSGPFVIGILPSNKSLNTAYLAFTLLLNYCYFYNYLFLMCVLVWRIHTTFSVLMRTFSRTRLMSLKGFCSICQRWSLSRMNDVINTSYLKLDAFTVKFHA